MCWLSSANLVLGHGLPDDLKGVDGMPCLLAGEPPGAVLTVFSAVFIGVMVGRLTMVIVLVCVAVFAKPRTRRASALTVLRLLLRRSRKQEPSD